MKPRNSDKKSLLKSLLSIPVSSCTLSTEQIKKGSKVFGEMTRVTSWLYLGSRFNAADKDALLKANITHIINLSKAVPNFFATEGNRQHSNLVVQYNNNFCVEDSAAVDISNEMKQFCLYLENIRKEKAFGITEKCSTSKKHEKEYSSTFGSLNNHDQKSRQKHFIGSVLVHCKCGVSRAPTFVAAYLMKFAAEAFNHESLVSTSPDFFEKLSHATSALEWLSSIRPCINPNVGFRGHLHIWENAPIPTNKTAVVGKQLLIKKSQKRNKDREIVRIKICSIQ